MINEEVNSVVRGSTTDVSLHAWADDDIEVHAIFGQQPANPLAGVEQLAKLGVERLMVPAFFFMGPGGLDRLADFGERVALQTESL